MKKRPVNLELSDVNIADDALGIELKNCELPNHFGFTNKKAWNHGIRASRSQNILQ